MIRAERADDVLSIGEFRERIDLLTDADWMKLGKLAEYLGWGLAVEGEDILHIAICKTLEGKRKCPRNLPVIVFLRGVMQSLVSAYIKKRKRDPLAQSVELVNDGEVLEEIDLKPNKDTPEEILIASQTLKNIEQMLSGNEILEMVFIAQQEGYSRHEIQEFARLSDVQYASALRNIRRKLNKLDIEESEI